MITRTDLRRSPYRIVLTAPGPVTEEALQQVHLTLTWDGDLCKAKLTNTGNVAVNVREVVLFSVPNSLPDETSLYAEGFQMLSQTGGTLAKPVALGGYTDHAHYKLPQPEGALTVYNLLLLTPPADAPSPKSTAPHEPLRQTHLFAFTSAKRFTGKFHLFSNQTEISQRRIEVVQDTDFVFNWEDRPQSLTIHMPARTRWQLSDFWSNGALGRHFDLYEVKDLPPHSARLLKSEIGPLG